MESDTILKAKSTKKKSVAPLCKGSKAPVITEGRADSAADNFLEFSDDMLDEIFNAVPESGPNKLNAGGSKIVQPPSNSAYLVDLDDWKPQSLTKESAPKGSATPTATLISNKGFMTPKSTCLPVSNRKEMLFSSQESEPDSTLRLRFCSRNIPASKLKSLCETHTKVSLYQAPKYTETKDWFTFGVVSSRDVLKKPGSGRMDVTDLSAEPYSVRFLLFGSAFNDFGKIPVGSIVCIIKPAKGKPVNGSQSEAMLVFNADQIILAGNSKDFGMCAGTKKAGGACRAVVNVSICRYCKFHALAEYKQKKMAQDIKAAAAGVGLNSSKTGLWNAQATQAKFLNPAKKNLALIKKDSETLNKLNASLSTSASRSSSSNSHTTQRQPPSLPKSLTGTLPKLDQAALMAAAASRVPPSSQKRKECDKSPDDRSSGQSKKALIEVGNTLISVSPPSSRSTPSPRLSAAKKKALQFVRENGVIAKEKTKTVILPTKDDQETKKTSGITDEFIALMNEKPRDATLLKDAEGLERDKRFEKLALAEEVSEKLIKTHELPTKALRCVVCKKNYHQMPLQCVMNKHESRIVMATKRFFECNGCRGRTTTLERMPSAECAKCGVWSWRRCGLAPDRICNAAPQLAVRGLEEKFIHSIVKDPNLNLLVPEES